MRILHFVQSISDIHGSFFYLKKQHALLNQYGIEQYYLSYEKNHVDYKNELGSISDYIYLLDNHTISDLLYKTIKPDMIHFDDVYSSYIINKSHKHQYFYELCKEMITVRTVHDYSSLVCPKYLTQGEKTYCDKPINKECLSKKCINIDDYEMYKAYLKSLKCYDGLFYFSNNIYSIMRDMKIDETKLFKLPPLISRTHTYSYVSDKVILFAGRLVPQKGIAYLLKAMARMNLRDWKLVIAGTCEKSHFRKLVSLANTLQIQHNVCFVGHLPQQELFQYLSKVRVMAFPSIGHETYGFSGAEAIAYGVPVIAFDIEGIDEWLIEGITGMKVPIKDIDAYAQAMESLLTDDIIYKQYRENCIQWSGQLQLEEQTKILYSHYDNIYNKAKKK